MLRQLVPAALVIAAAAGAAPAQTSFPMVTHCTPVAVQRGTAAEVTVEGQMNFAGARGWLVEGAGLTATVVPPPPAKDPTAPVRSATPKITAAADAPLGVPELRLVTALGVS